MAVTYEVDYIVKVTSGDTLAQLEKLSVEFQKLSETSKRVGKLVRGIEALKRAVTKCSGLKLDINTDSAMAKLDALERKLMSIRSKANINVTATTNTASNNKAGRTTVASSTMQTRNVMAAPSGWQTLPTGQRVFYSNHAPSAHYAPAGQHFEKRERVGVPKGYERGLQRAIKIAENSATIQRFIDHDNSKLNKAVKKQQDRAQRYKNTAQQRRSDIAALRQAMDVNRALYSMAGGERTLLSQKNPATLTNAQRTRLATQTAAAARLDEDFQRMQSQITSLGQEYKQAVVGARKAQKTASLYNAQKTRLSNMINGSGVDAFTSGYVLVPDNNTARVPTLPGHTATPTSPAPKGAHISPLNPIGNNSFPTGWHDTPKGRAYFGVQKPVSYLPDGSLQKFDRAATGLATGYDSQFAAVKRAESALQARVDKGGDLSKSRINSMQRQLTDLRTQAKIKTDYIKGLENAKLSFYKDIDPYLNQVAWTKKLEAETAKLLGGYAPGSAGRQKFLADRKIIEDASRAQEQALLGAYQRAQSAMSVIDGKILQAQTERAALTPQIRGLKRQMSQIKQTRREANRILNAKPSSEYYMRAWQPAPVAPPAPPAPVPTPAPAPTPTPTPTPAPSGGSNNNRGNNGGGSSSKNKAPTAPKATPNNLGYKLFGPTPLTANGGMALGMLKGMGIAYGFSAVGQLFSDIFSESTAYDNTMQSVENILRAHDPNQRTFDNRFSKMQNTIRDIGISTRYKVTEVADAARFLAMAGYDVNSINSAMAPITNIALVGDTNLAETADMVTNVMSAYRMEGHQMRRAADVMGNTFTMSNTTLPEVAEALKYAGSLLEAGEVSFEESAAAVGVLGNAGIKGSQAGTTLRTILNNIINPRGKYRKQAWKDTKIETMREDGVTPRSIAEIFTELADKGYGVKKFYELFDKTAAAGAVALIGQVDRWNQIIEENFMSNGMMQEMADKKKNTIQGLWARLTSSISENGLRAFEGVQGQISNMLLNGIDWLGSREGREAFVETFGTILDIFKKITQATSTLFDVLSWLKTPILFIMKLQLVIWPLIKSITILKSLFLSVMGVARAGDSLVKIFAAIGALQTQFGPWGGIRTYAANAIQHYATGGAVPLISTSQGAGVTATYSGSEVIGQAWGNPNAVLVRNTNGTISIVPSSSVATNGAVTPTPVPAPSGGSGGSGGSNSSDRPSRKQRFKNFLSKNAGFGVAASIGSVGGYMIGSEMYEDSPYAGMIGGAIGTTAASVMAGIASSLSGGLVTLGAAAAIGAIAWVVSAIKKMRNLATQIKDLNEQIRNDFVDDLDISDKTNLAVANMRLYGSEQMSEMDRYRKLTQLANEYWKAKNGPESKDSPAAGGPEGKTLSGWLDDISSINRLGNRATFEKIFTELVGGNIESGVNSNGTSSKHWLVNGIPLFESYGYGLTPSNSAQIVGAAYGKTTSIKDYENKLLPLLLKGKSAEHAAELLAGLRDSYLPVVDRSDAYNTDLRSKEMREWTEAEWRKNFAYQTTLKPRLDKADERIKPWMRIREAFDKGEAISNLSLQQALKPFMPVTAPLLDEKLYGIVGTPEWFANIEAAQANPKRFGLSIDAADNMVDETYRTLLEIYDGANDAIKPLLGGLLNEAMWFKAYGEDYDKLPKGGMLPGGGVIDHLMSYGKKYTWDTPNRTLPFAEKWWVDEDGKPLFMDSRHTDYSMYLANGREAYRSKMLMSEVPFTLLESVAGYGKLLDIFPAKSETENISNRTSAISVPDFYNAGMGGAPLSTFKWGENSKTASWGSASAFGLSNTALGRLPQINPERYALTGATLHVDEIKTGNDFKFENLVYIDQVNVTGDESGARTFAEAAANALKSVLV